MRKQTSIATDATAQSENAALGKESANLDWFRYQLGVWASQNLQDFPWRRTNDPYAIFITEFLLQKTGAATVAPVYQTFIERYPNLPSLAAAPLEDVACLSQPLGLHFRADRLCRSVQIIIEQHSGKIPERESKLLKLPGVGSYTARAICAAFWQPKAVLDTNVARILERFFGLQGNRAKSRCKLLWKAAELVAPNTEVGKWNLTLIDFGAAICTAKNPRCADCPLSDCYNYYIESTHQKLKSA